MSSAVIGAALVQSYPRATTCTPVFKHRLRNIRMRSNDDDDSDVDDAVVVVNGDDSGMVMLNRASACCLIAVGYDMIW